MLCAHFLLAISIEIHSVRVCMYSLSALVVAASLERDLDDLVPHAHIKLAAAVEDQQASDRLPLPGREQLDLLQQAAPRGLIERGKHFPDSAIIWRRERERGVERIRSQGGRRVLICMRAGEVVEERAKEEEG